MPQLLPGATRSILTIFSLAVLCTLSFLSFHRTSNSVDTPLPQDSLFSVYKRDIPHQPRAFHHARDSINGNGNGINGNNGNANLALSSALAPLSLPISSVLPSSSAASVQSPTPQPVSSTVPTSSSAVVSPSPSPSASSLLSSTSSPTSSVISTTTTSRTALASTSPSSSTTTFSRQSTTRTTTSSTQVASKFAVGQFSTFDDASSSDTFTGFLITKTPTTSTVDLPSSTAGAISKSFFANKAAVGATFSILGIIGALAGAVALATILKRRRKSHPADDEEYFEKYFGRGAVGRGDNVQDEPADYGRHSPGMSATDLDTFPAPPGAYPDRTIHYGPSNPGSAFHSDEYGIEYTPDTPHAITTPVNESGAVQGDHGYGQYQDNSYPTSSVDHPFADPFNVPHVGPAPVSYPRPAFGRTQEMVATDSYYGPNSAGVGAGGMAFAQ